MAGLKKSRTSGKLLKASSGKLLSGEVCCCCPYYWKATLCNTEICDEEGPPIYLCANDMCPGSVPIEGGTVVRIGLFCYLVDDSTNYYPPGAKIPPGGVALPDDAVVFSGDFTCEESCEDCPALSGFFRLVNCQCSELGKVDYYITCECYFSLINDLHHCPTFLIDGLCLQPETSVSYPELPVGGVEVDCANYYSDGCCGCCATVDPDGCDSEQIYPHTTDFQSGCDDPPGNYCNATHGPATDCCCGADMVLNGFEEWIDIYPTGGPGGTPCTQRYSRTYNALTPTSGTIHIHYELCDGFVFDDDEDATYDACAPGSPDFQYVYPVATAPPCSPPSHPLGVPNCYTGTVSADCTSATMSATGSTGVSTGSYEATFTLSRDDAGCRGGCEGSSRTPYSARRSRRAPAGGYDGDDLILFGSGGEVPP